MCNASTPSIPTPKALAATVGITGAYASMILTGKRPCSAEIALAAFRAYGVRLGLLGALTPDDLVKLCSSCAADGAGGASLSAISAGGFSSRTGPASGGIAAGCALAPASLSFSHCLDAPVVFLPFSTGAAGQGGALEGVNSSPNEQNGRAAPFSILADPFRAGPLLGRNGAALPAGAGAEPPVPPRQEATAVAAGQIMTGALADAE